MQKEQQLDSVIVKGHRIDRNVLAGRPIQVMQKEELEQLGLTNLADAVKKFAGTNVKDYGGIGGMKTVSVRNLGAHHTAVSYDGITISNTQAGQIDIGRYTLDNIQSVSMAIGEQEELMQSARHYAAAGILNMLSERPHFENGRKDALRFRLRAGSFGLFSPSLLYWRQLGNATTLSLNGSYMRADGTYPFTLINGIEKTKEKRYNSDIYSWQGEANIYHTFKDDSQLDWKACWYYSQRGLPGSVVLYNNRSEERLWDEDFFTQAIYKRRLSAHWNLQARMKYTHSWNRYEDTDVKYTDGKQVDVDRQNEYYGSATIGWNPIAILSLALAQDLSYNNLRNNINIANNSESPYPERFTSLTSLTAQLRTQRVDITGNIVATYATEKVKSGNQPDDRKRLSPSLSLSYRVLHDQALFLRAMMKSTFRMPSFNDLYYRRMGNTGLRPEIAREYNIGITWSGQPLRAVRYLSFTLDGYYNDVTDKIVAFPSTYVWKMANFGKVHIKGVDMTLATEIPASRQVSVIVTAAYTWQQAKDKLEQSASYNRQLPYTPQHSGNLSLLVRNPWVNIGYSMLMQGKRWSSAQNTSEYSLNAYWEHTLTLSKEFLLRWARMNIQGSIHNFTDTHYEIIKYYPMPGRSYHLSATITF
ncbi:MAG: TonB-dependent receptor plug domain-containing protein [Prevotella sp.]|nr:TonB-dependent receptor plug domain-containing protein [Prevotella sp.]